jgi:hypothetical protein
MQLNFCGLAFSSARCPYGYGGVGVVWSSTDFIGMFSAVFWSVITGVAIYPVLRDAKSLADAAGPKPDELR